MIYMFLTCQSHTGYALWLFWICVTSGHMIDLGQLTFIWIGTESSQLCDKQRVQWCKRLMTWPQYCLLDVVVTQVTYWQSCSPVGVKGCSPGSTVLLCQTCQHSASTKELLTHQASRLLDPALEVNTGVIVGGCWLVLQLQEQQPISSISFSVPCLILIHAVKHDSRTPPYYTHSSSSIRLTGHKVLLLHSCANVKQLVMQWHGW